MFFADNLRVLDATMADSKKIADMPLRDTSPWSVLRHFLFESPSNEPEAVGIRPALPFWQPVAGFDHDGFCRPHWHRGGLISGRI